MRTSNLSARTVRPGTVNYSAYRSDPRLARRQPTPSSGRRVHSAKLSTWLVLALAVLAAGVIGFKTGSSSGPTTPKSSSAQLTANSFNTIPVDAPAANQCSDNKLAKFIKVSIAERHLWACQVQKTVYDAPVITGMEMYAADRTPKGTYRIYGKIKDTVLTGSDSTGSWRDPVKYWLPFLDNHYGTYGFHDATWRKDSEFGNVSPNSKKASHGCVEVPLDASAWLFKWAPAGTVVTVED